MFEEMQSAVNGPGMAGAPDSAGGGAGGFNPGNISFDGAGVVGLIFLILGILIGLAYLVLLIVSWWRIYTKAGRPGWANLIPVYGAIEFFNVAWGNGAYFLFMLLPGINILVFIITIQKLSESFGRGIGYTLGLFLLPGIFIPILGLGKDKHLRYEAKKALEADKEAAYAAVLAARAEEEAKAAAEGAPAEAPAEPAAEPAEEAPAE